MREDVGCFETDRVVDGQLLEYVIPLFLFVYIRAHQPADLSHHERLPTRLLTPGCIFPPAGAIRRSLRTPRLAVGMNRYGIEEIGIEPGLPEPILPPGTLAQCDDEISCHQNPGSTLDSWTHRLHDFAV